MKTTITRAFLLASLYAPAAWSQDEPPAPPVIAAPPAAAPSPTPVLEADPDFVLPVLVGPAAGCVAGAVPTAAAVGGGLAILSNTGSSCSTETLLGLGLLLGGMVCGPGIGAAGVFVGALVESLLRGRSLLPPLIGGGVGLALSLVAPAMLFGGGALAIVLVSGTLLGPQYGTPVAFAAGLTILAAVPILTIATVTAASAMDVGEPKEDDAARSAVPRPQGRHAAVMAY